MSHVAHESDPRVSGGTHRSVEVTRGSRGMGAPAGKARARTRGEQSGALEAREGDIAVPGLHAFAGAKRTELRALATSSALGPLRGTQEDVTRVASMCPWKFGWAQTLARLRGDCRPAMPLQGITQLEPRLARVSALGAPRAQGAKP